MNVLHCLPCDMVLKIELIQKTVVWLASALPPQYPNCSIRARVALWCFGASKHLAGIFADASTSRQINEQKKKQQYWTDFSLRPALLGVKWTPLQFCVLRKKRAIPTLFWLCLLKFYNSACHPTPWEAPRSHVWIIHRHCRAQRAISHLFSACSNKLNGLENTRILLSAVFFANPRQWNNMTPHNSNRSDKNRPSLNRQQAIDWCVFCRTSDSLHDPHPPECKQRGLPYLLGRHRNVLNPVLLRDKSGRFISPEVARLSTCLFTWTFVRLAVLSKKEISTGVQISQIRNSKLVVESWKAGVMGSFLTGTLLGLVIICLTPFCVSTALPPVRKQNKLSKHRHCSIVLEKTALVSGQQLFLVICSLCSQVMPNSPKFISRGQDRLSLWKNI